MTTSDYPVQHKDAGNQMMLVTPECPHGAHWHLRSAFWLDGYLSEGPNVAEVHVRNIQGGPQVAADVLLHSRISEWFAVLATDTQGVVEARLYDDPGNTVVTMVEEPADALLLAGASAGQSARLVITFEWADEASGETWRVASSELQHNAMGGRQEA